MTPEGQLYVKLADVPGRGCLYKIVGGQWDGYECLGPRGLDTPGRTAVAMPYWKRDAAGRSQADEAAESLLLSLLDKRQRDAYERDRRFWVPTIDGYFLLGRKYDIRCRWEQPSEEVSVCVVPTGWDSDRPELPDADFWACLLLNLHEDTEHFARVAIIRSNLHGRYPTSRCSRCGRDLTVQRHRWLCPRCPFKPAPNRVRERLTGRW